MPNVLLNTTEAQELWETVPDEPDYLARVADALEKAIQEANANGVPQTITIEVTPADEDDENTVE